MRSALPFDELELEEKSYADQDKAKDTNDWRVYLERVPTFRVDGRLTQLKYDCTYSLHTSEHTEGVLRSLKFKAKQLLCVRVHCSVHKPPAEGKKVDQESFLVLLDHQKAREPDQQNIEHIEDDACPAAHSVHNLGHD